MNTVRKILHFLRDMLKDYYAIVSSLLTPTQKRKLTRAYTKITILYLVSKVKKIRHISFLSYQVDTPNFYLFYFLFREIFVHGVYFVNVGQVPHRIVDCGANTGMTILYYKWLWPDTAIDAYEPDPDTYHMLEKHIISNNIHGVSVYNKAVSSREGSIAFYSDKAHPGCGRNTTIRERGHANYVAIDVEAIDALDICAKDKIDILKMDIEGAEFDVITRLVEHKKLQDIGHIVLEYHHNIPGQEHTLADFLKLLDRSGKKYTLSCEDISEMKQNPSQDINIHAR